MARNKKAAKKSKDARGYSQGPPHQQHQQHQQKQKHQSSSSTAAASNANGKNVNNKSKAPSISTKTHDEMKDLLGQFNNSNTISGPSSSSATATITTVPPSDRFLSRLTNIVANLDVLGFTPLQIEKVVPSLQYEITLETSLDWLCLNINTLELPPLFTDGELRQDLCTVTTVDSLVVLKKKGDCQDQEENILVVDAPSITTADNTSGDRDGIDEDEVDKQKEAEQKQWLLEQYEYEQDETIIHESESSTPQRDEETTTQSTKITTTATPEEQRLAEEERTLALLEADANDDANNYMRSKVEIKQLKNEVKRARQKVAGLRRKVERSRAALRKQLQEEKDKEKKEEEKKEEGDTNVEVAVIKKDNNEVEEEEECGGGLFDMFSKDEQPKEEVPKNAATEEKSPPTTPPPTIQDYTIPKSWTGNTPQKKLDEILKKLKLPRAKYTKLRSNAGFTLAVTLAKLDKTLPKQPPQKWEARYVDFVKDSSLKDYLAMHALYAMDPSLQLYRIFPGAFRDLWLSWMNDVKEERDSAKKSVEDAKDKRMEYLMGLIAEAAGVVKKSNGLGNGGGGGGGGGRDEKRDGQREEDDGFEDQDEDDVIDNWDDDSVDDDNLPARVNKTTTATKCSTKGKKMQTEFYRRQSTPSYQKMKTIRNSLPMAAFRSTVLDTVTNNPVTILCAETGAGKSTQCAQYILEQALLDGHGDDVNIICTQPRRVAATSLAERVSEEMSDKLGNMVGYQIRMESKRSSRTKLLFCTTGVILRRLQDDPTLTGVTHVICDEVHERAQQIDVLLIILRQLLRTTRPDLKVILMSATMETELFRSFFQGAPMISVPGRTFPVSNYYLEDLFDATDHIIEEGSRYAYRENYKGGETASLWVTTRGGEKRKETVDLSSQGFTPGGVSDAYAGYKMSTRRSMERVNEEVINYDLIEDVLKLVTNQAYGSDDTLLAPDGADMSEGSILIFLPGLGEIKALSERLDSSRIFRDRQRFDLIPLHSTLSSRDQRRAFLPSKPGCRKIICATNIAETSVTIPDVVYVIDTGRVREVRRNKKTSTSMLVTDWCPQSSAKQRQGRAGRVQSGICLKLYSFATAERVMKATNEPELRRVPLEEICMSILASGFAKSCMNFLGQAPQPPSTESVQAAMNVLYDVGAIEKTGTGDIMQQSEHLTPLGFHLAKLPVDVKLGKMLIFGALFRCIDPILTIAASLSSKSPFAAFVHDAAVAKAKQKVFADPDSDFMTYCNVWDAYETSTIASRRFCQENYLNHIALREIGDARRQFLDLLCGIGFLDRNAVMGNGSRIDPELLKSCHFNRHAKKTEVVHAVICAGLYPNVLHLKQSPSMNYTMWHKEERIYFHGASVNAAKKRFLSSENWVLFHEKFGTPNRTSVSTTAFVHPFALLLFGGSVFVKHTERTVIVDNWMSIGMSAQTGVILRELRKKVEIFLQRMIKCADNSEIEQLDSSMIDGIIKILSS